MMGAPKASRVAIVTLQVLLLGGLIILGLTGCAGQPPPLVQTRIQEQTVKVPDGLLSCDGAPALTPWVRQSDVADYVSRLYEAWADCSNDVAAVKKFNDAASGRFLVFGPAAPLAQTK